MALGNVGEAWLDNGVQRFRSREHPLAPWPILAASASFPRPKKSTVTFTHVSASPDTVGTRTDLCVL
ncbi:hypothetical protein SKAU_G00279380 [Synaphobranchus kaupii]|uniref:Uncharacterized protein n=1 Tax=Synaphobranchus kaupii TaxID=118154 RepID=A0A9Q1ILP3_SYNKA|nr:hypothetical protein SKAU_G00279380 [Synaphobranchus kaupii]